MNPGDWKKAVAIGRKAVDALIESSYACHSEVLSKILKKAILREGKDRIESLIHHEGADIAGAKKRLFKLF